ncbi:MAG: hypothetical protein H6R15_3026 [Proteobacteria bacterium]|nr:hypothetical protein [Pseudomonadota bacterium]
MKAFKSGKQRRVELLAARERRRQRRSRQAKADASPAVKRCPAACVPVDPARLQPYNSYDVPDFVWRGYYVDLAFRCRDCGAEGVWTAERQRWWYELAGGDVYTTACRCAPCRAKARQRKTEARQRSLPGWLDKQAARAGSSPAMSTRC